MENVNFRDYMVCPNHIAYAFNNSIKHSDSNLSSDVKHRLIQNP